MKVFKGFLIALLAVIVMLCAVIGISALHPELFDRFGKTEEDPAEPATYTFPTEDPDPNATDSTVSKASVSPGSDSGTEPPLDDDYFAEDVEGSGIREGMAPSYDSGGETLDVPHGLDAYTGLEEPYGEYDILDDDKADEIETALSTGPTGDGLEFDEEFYPYYAMLDDEGQHLYRQIYANAMELNQDFKAVEKNMPWSSFRHVFEAVFNDHPELFWLNTEFSAGYRGNGDCLEIVLSFNRTVNDIESSSRDFDTGAEGIESAASGDIYEQEKAVHDAILESFSYDLKAEMNQSAYSGFVNNNTVCAGYARCFQYAMQQLGIPCYYCSGTAGEPHAWNIIKLDGDYYNVDATWDDSDETWQYEYFNLSDDDLKKDHRRTSLSVYLPACGGGRYSGLEEEPVPDTEDEQAPELPDGIYVSSLDEYFRQCADRIKEEGKGAYTFDLYTTDKDVYNSCMSSYRDGTAKGSYMSEVFDLVDDPQGMSVDFIGTEGDGVYKMTQRVRLW